MDKLMGNLPVESYPERLAPKLAILEHLHQSAQYVTLDNKIKCLSLAVYFLATPLLKL